MPEGRDITVRGVVTRILRQRSFYIQDGDFGITVFSPDERSETIAINDYVEVYGFTGQFNGVLQITGAPGSDLPEVSKLSLTSPNITPFDIIESAYNASTLLPNFEGRLVRIKGLKLSAPFTPLVIDETQGTGNANFDFKLGAVTVNARFERFINVQSRRDINAFFNGMSVDTKFDYTGILGRFNAGLQLAITNASDLSLNADPVVLPTSLTVTAATTPAEVVVGLGLQLSTTVLPANADDKSVTWSSASPEVATVSSSGLVTGVSVGTSVITATSVAEDTVLGTLTVTVNPAPLTLDGVEFGIGDQTLKVGQSIDSQATLLPLGYVGQGITYTSSDNTIATVTSAGVIEARAAGTATITAAATEDNTKTDTLSVTVADVMTIADAKIAVVNTMVTVNGVITKIMATNEFYIQNGSEAVQILGPSASLSTSLFSEGDFVQVTGPAINSAAPRRIGTTSLPAGTSLSVEKIGFLTAPEVTPLVITEATYNVTSTPITNQWRLVQIDGLTPPQPWVNVVSSTTINRTFKLGQLDVTARISQFTLASEITAVNELFTDFWKNDTVNFNGILSVFNGALQILPSGAKDFTLVEAEPVLVSSITVSGAGNATSFASNGQLQLSANVLPANADVLGVTWSSSNDAIATVDQNGLVSGVSTGTVTMTATSAEIGSLVVGTLELTVTEPLVLTAIELTASLLDVVVGKTLDLTVTPTPSAWVGTYSFVSSDETKATVSNLGVVTGVALGSITITATSVETPAVSDTIALSVIVETSLYSTGFESSETFAAGSTYNNTSEALRGPAGQQWAFYYGTPSTTSPLVGLQSAQMRFYTNATSNLGYARTAFEVTDVNYVTFDARSEAASMSVIVSISKDGGTTWTDEQVIALTTTLGNYKYIVPTDKVTGNTQFKFQLTVSNTGAANRLYLDTINMVKVER